MILPSFSQQLPLPSIPVSIYTMWQLVTPLTRFFFFSLLSPLLCIGSSWLKSVGIKTLFQSPHIHQTFPNYFFLSSINISVESVRKEKSLSFLKFIIELASVRYQFRQNKSPCECRNTLYSLFPILWKVTQIDYSWVWKFIWRYYEYADS